MSTARLTIWRTGDTVDADDWNAEFGNILDHGPDTLISPLTAILAAGGFKLTNLASGTAAGDGVRYEDKLVAATQANQETGTSLATFVTPLRQQFHASACKAFAYGNYAGTATLKYNVTSVTDSGTGFQTWTWTTDFSSAAYACVAGMQGGTGVAYVSVKPISASAAELKSYIAGSLADATLSTIAAWGDQ